MNLWQHRVLALAAVAQAAAAVRQLARHGQLEPEQDKPVLIDSILNQSAADIAAIYGQSENLRWGLEQFLLQLGSSQQKDIELTRYVVGLLALERKLNKSPEVAEQLSQRIDKIQQQQQQFHFDQHTIVANLAGTYSDLLSPLMRPLQISGKPEYLQQSGIQNQIRAYLLAGIRAVVLWRQLGGKRRHFIFSRQRMVRTAQQLLRDMREQSESKI